MSQDPGGPRPTASVGAVVVHYGSWEPTLRALAALRQHAPEVSVVVVDNGPYRDGAEAEARASGTSPAPAALTDVTVIRPESNVGYGAACNLGVARLDARLLLLSNNDVEVGPETVARLRRRLESDPGLAAVGPRFFDGSGHPRRSVRRAPTPWRVLCENLFLARLLSAVPSFQGHHTVSCDETRPRPIETLLGALILIRRDAFDAIGGFDEGYFFYAEETDLFARLSRGGWAIAYEPAAAAVHHEGVASGSVPQATLDLWLHRGLLRYAARFHGAAGRRRTARALRAGARLRWLLSFLPGTSPRPQRLQRRRRYADILAFYRSGQLGGTDRSGVTL